MRCSTSGRLTPAAATLTRSSSGLGWGLATSATCRTSGPPGFAMTTARMSLLLSRDEEAGHGAVSRRVRAGPGEWKIPRRDVQPRQPAGSDRAHRGDVPEPGGGGARAGADVQGGDPAVSGAGIEARQGDRQEKEEAGEAVSYTHLTLPTSDLV